MDCFYVKYKNVKKVFQLSCHSKQVLSLTKRLLRLVFEDCSKQNLDSKI